MSHVRTFQQKTSSFERETFAFASYFDQVKRLKGVKDLLMKTSSCADQSSCIFIHLFNYLFGFRKNWDYGKRKIFE